MICPQCGITFIKTNNRHKFCSPKCKKISHGDKYKFSARKSGLKIKYGLSWENWEQMYKDQQGCCAICKKFCLVHPEHKRDGLCVDHCHDTGVVRALLCVPCNSAIGQLQENPEIIMNALAYVLKAKKERK